MKTVKNKTHRPLRVPLPHGKVLHLNPNQTGKVPDQIDHPPLQKLIDAGEIELIDDGNRGHGTGPGGSESVHASPHGHVPTKVVHPSGDR